MSRKPIGEAPGELTGNLSGKTPGKSPGKSPGKKRVVFRIALCVFAFAAVCAIGFQTYLVNAEAAARKTETEHYGMGEWVDLAGTFFTHESSELQDDYSLKVKSAQKLSYNEFVQKYGVDKNDVVEGLNEKSVIDLEFEIKHKGTEEGSIPLLPMILIPQRKNTYFIWNSDLWLKNEPTSQDVMFLALKPNSEHTTHIPYTVNVFDEEYTAFRQAIPDTYFELVVANMPHRIVIDVSLDEGLG